MIAVGGEEEGRKGPRAGGQRREACWLWASDPRSQQRSGYKDHHRRKMDGAGASRPLLWRRIKGAGSEESPSESPLLLWAPLLTPLPQ